MSKMKTASQMLDDLLRQVKPPKGVSISLTEADSQSGTDPNWVAGAGVMDISAANRFSELVAQLRKTDPIIDWTEVAAQPEKRKRIAKWLSEVTD